MPTKQFGPANCPAGTHWDDASNSCVSDDIRFLYELESQVSYLATQRVLSVRSPEEQKIQIKNSVRILKAALKKLTEGRS